VLLLVVLSMLTLFMLLGVTYIVMAARTRNTSRAFLRLAGDQSLTAATLQPLMRDAALQVIRGTTNARSAIKYHDLLADKYGSASQYTATDVQSVANNQLIAMTLNTGSGPALTGRVLTFLGGPYGVRQTSTRIADAVLITGQTRIWVPRPARLATPAQVANTAVLINNAEFTGTGFSSSGLNQQGVPSLNDAALQPNRSGGFSSAFDAQTNTGLTSAQQANEDYDALDEQNMALALPDGSVKSFERKELIDLWVRDYARRVQNSGGTPPATQSAAESALRDAILTQANSGDNSLSSDQRIAIASLRRATMRPFAFDHYQDTARTTDFAGRSLATLMGALGSPTGDVDNDGDGVRDSIWLDLGAGVLTMDERTLVKPLFAVHCVDLGGRLSLNAHGSIVHANETSVTNNAAFAPRREDTNGPITPKKPTSLRAGLGFGPADVRLDAVIGSTFESALMFGTSSAAATQDGVRREVGSLVGRYGDGVQTAASPAFPGVPNYNDRRASADRNTWTDRGIPADFWTRATDNGVFLGAPPDMWSRLSVGIDHRGHPFYASRAPTLALSETTDNPYELDLSRSRVANGYVQVGATAAAMDQPFTASELEALLRPFDLDNAPVLPPRALAVALSAAGSSDIFASYRALLTTDTWDTPAVIARADFNPDPGKHDPDLVAGLKMDINRPLGDTIDNDTDGVVDEPGETNDGYAATLTDSHGNPGWLLTRGGLPAGMPAQPGASEPLLRARQVLAWHVFSLLDTLAQTFAGSGTPHTLRLFAVKTDNDGATTPVAVDPALNSGNNGNTTFQGDANRQSLAQWAVNVVDFFDPDAIMTPFRYKAATGTPPGNQYVVWGCEHPDLLITETLAFHDRRTADTKCDPSGEKTTDFATEYQTVYNTYMSWVNGGKIGPAPAYPDPQDSDNNVDADDMDFDQVRIPEGSLFLELLGTRNPNLPNLPRELYAYDTAANTWYLDIGRVPAGGTEPVWRLAVSTNRALQPSNDIFQKIAANPDTQLLTPGTTAGLLAETVAIDRYVWFCAQRPPQTGTGPTRTNTFYRRDGSLPEPRVRPGGYLVVGPRSATAIGSIEGGSGSQKWGVPSQQQIVLNAGAPASDNPAVGTYDLKGQPNPLITASDVGGNTGNALPPPNERVETTATWLAMDPPTSWTTWNTAWKGVGKTGIGLNVSEPLGTAAYYRCPTEKNPATDVYDAYGPLDSEAHTSFINLPLDRDGGPLADNLLSGGTYANYCTVFVERLADPTRPHDADPNSTTWNPYIAVDFMPIDLTVFNGESADRDPSETQGPDRAPALAELPAQLSSGIPSSPATPLPPNNVPLPAGTSQQFAVRHTYFHTRQRGFGSDLPGYDNYLTLFGVGGGRSKRNPHPFKPAGSLDDLRDTPLLRSGVATDRLPGGKATVARSAADLAAAEKAYFRHELGQSPVTRSVASDWTRVPFHSLGWVNPSFGRRLDTADGVPAAYVGAPDRPFPWLVWNDRPFANPYELIFVPRTSPGRLLTNYRNLDYPLHADYNIGSGYNVDDMYGACTPGAHLLPITSITDTPASGSSRSRNADCFVRIFEYVRVRSPFTGTEIVLTGAADDGRSDRLVPPFNRIPRYREPGRVNINTIYPTPAPGTLPTTGAIVWSALCGDETQAGVPSHENIVASGLIQLPFQTGLAAGNGIFKRPFRVASGSRTNFSESSTPRSQANANFARSLLTNPPCTSPAAWFADVGTTPTIEDRFTVRSTTMLRDGPVIGGAVTKLFPAPSTDAGLFATDAWANDGSRNAWFRFESLVRAQANATVRSEGYAIWITLGLFEVAADSRTISDPGTGVLMPLYPDGYRLVREYGSDTGDVTRHRSFYLFDRSIPVGYQQGSDNNVQDAILVERVIE
jgi:hypothetical protein